MSQKLSSSRFKGQKTQLGQDENKSKKILESVIDLIDEHPSEIPTLDQVAKRAGIAKGTLFLYFSHREVLLYQTLSQSFQEAYAEVDAQIQNQFGYRRISSQEFAEIFINAIESNPSISLILPRLPEIVQKLNFYPRLFSDFCSWFQRMTSRVEGLSPQSFEGSARFIFSSLCKGLFLQSLQFLDLGFTRDSLASEVVLAFQPSVNATANRGSSAAAKSSDHLREVNLITKPHSPESSEKTTAGSDKDQEPHPQVGFGLYNNY